MILLRNGEQRKKTSLNRERTEQLHIANPPLPRYHQQHFTLGGDFIAAAVFTRLDAARSGRAVQ